MAGLLTNANYINDTIKPAIKSAIEAQGVTVPSTDSFLDYADRIAEIEGGGDGYVLQDLPTGAISSFSDGVDLPLNSLKVSIEAVQSGSGTPSPQNVRPITGWDSVDVDVVGKNFAEITANESSITVITDTEGYKVGFKATIGQNPYVITIKVCDVKIKKGKTYTLSGSPEGYSNVSYRLDVRVNQNTIYNNWNEVNNPTLTATEDAILGVYLRVGANYILDSDSIFRPQIELGNQATTYEPYQGKTTTIPLSSTCYGGELDVTNGELKVTHGNIASYNGETLPSTWISSMDEYTAGGTPTTGAQVVYELATPTTIQIQPTAIRTLDGVNNIWADCGDVLDGEYFVGDLSEYELYDYIQSDGTQVIDLGFAPQNGDVVTVSDMLLSAQTSASFMWASIDSSAWLGVVQNPNNKTVYSNNTSGSSWPSYISDQMNVDSLTANRDYTSNLCMFGYYQSGAYQHSITMRLYSVQINSNFYLPCKRKSDGAFGLWDVTNQAFLGDSAGGNAFTGGSKIMDL